MKEFLMSIAEKMKRCFPDVFDIVISEGVDRGGIFYIFSVERYDCSHFSTHIRPGESEKSIIKRLSRLCERELNKIGV